MNAAETYSAQILFESPDHAIAPAWHTTITLSLMLAMSLLGSRVKLMGFAGTRGRVPVYLITILMEWAIVAFIWYGLRLRGFRIPDLISGRWARPLDVLRDLGIAIAFLVVGGGLIQGLVYLLKASAGQDVRSMLPQSTTEMIVWVLMSMTAGFCEEVIYRGYFQRQFAILTRSVVGGIVLQGIVFGASHGYQGWKLMFIIAIYGSLFGFLARWRKSLRPGMIGHALQDSLGGLLARYM